jgi:hypothetical protein
LQESRIPRDDFGSTIGEGDFSSAATVPGPLMAAAVAAVREVVRKWRRREDGMAL